MPLKLALLLGISAAWAAGYVFIGAAKLMPPVTASAAMTVIAALVLVPGVRFGLRRPLLPTLRARPWVPMVMGVSAIAIPNLTVVAAEHSVPPALASLLGATVPIATILLTTFVTRETAFSLRKMAGILAAVAGLAIFVGGPALLAHPAEITGMLIMMSGGLVFAVNGLFAARQTRDLDACALAAWTVLFGAVALTLAAFAVEQPLQVDPAGALWALLGEGVAGMGLAYLGYYLLVAHAGAGFASLYAFLVPPLGLLAAAALGNESIGVPELLGLALVLAGLGLMTLGGRSEATATVTAATRDEATP